MVLPSLFTKSSKKSKTPDVPTLTKPGSSSPHKSGNLGTPPSSPDKKSHRVKDRERDSARRSSSYTSKQRSSKHDRNSHPLNLPPDELRRRISLMSDQGTPTPMDVDRESTSSPAPSSPAAAQAPGAFPTPNGASSDEPLPPPHRYTTSPPPESAKYAASKQEAAAPPAVQPTVDAELYKTAGNKFFKMKDYPMAIKEYTKGESSSVTLRSSRVLPWL
jgi:DnaJ family protein C protein 7